MNLLRKILRGMQLSDSRKQLAVNLQMCGAGSNDIIQKTKVSRHSPKDCLKRCLTLLAR